jgi:drug/metabolite transporter (DMT)-like permease
LQDAQPIPQSAAVAAPVVLAMLLHVLISAGTFIVAKVALGQFDPPALAQIRFVLATSALLTLHFARGGGLPRRSDLPALAFLGLIGTTLNQGLFLFGLARSTAAHGALLYAATPIFVLCLAVLRKQERLRARRALGVALAFTGVAILLFGRGLAFERAWLLGDALILLAVWAWALYTAKSRELVGRLGPTALTAWAMLLGTVFFLPLGVPALFAQDWTRVTAAGWASLAYVAFLTSVVSYLIWSWALARAEASRVAIFTNLQPIVTALLAWGFLHEPLTAAFAGATVLVLAGVALAER